MAIALILAPVLLGASDALDNYVDRDTASPAETIAAVEAHSDLWLLASILAILMTVTFVPVVFGLVRVFGARPSAVAWIGIALFAIGIIGQAGHRTLFFGAYGAAARDPDAGAAFPLTQDTGIQTLDATILLVMFLVGFTFGLLLIAVALWRSRAAPKWTAITLGVFVALPFITDSLTGVAAVAGAVAQAAVLLAAFYGIASSLIRPEPETPAERHHETAMPGVAR